MAELHDERPESERLRMQLQDASVETDAEFANLQALAEEYLKQADVPDVDADAAWEQVLRLAEPEPPHGHVHSHRAFFAAVAAAVMAGLLFAAAMIALAVPSARETVGRWSDEVFLSDAEAEPTSSTAGSSVGGELDAALSAAGIPESVVPRWFPNDCTPETVACEVWETGGEVTAALSNGGGSMTVTSGEQRNMQAALPAGGALQYTTGGVCYWIDSNADRTLVCWNTGQCFCRIELTGAPSVSDIQKMIDSIYIYE